MRKLILFCAISLGACASLKTAMEYDSTVHHVAMADDTYRIFEHPTGDRIMTTPSLGRATSQGLARGATFGIISPETPEQRHEAAARKHLNDTGRSHCSIISGYEIAPPQYEFRIACG